MLADAEPCRGGHVRTVRQPDRDGRRPRTRADPRSDTPLASTPISSVPRRARGRRAPPRAGRSSRGHPGSPRSRGWAPVCESTSTCWPTDAAASAISRQSATTVESIGTIPITPDGAGRTCSLRVSTTRRISNASAGSSLSRLISQSRSSSATRVRRVARNRARRTPRSSSADSPTKCPGPWTATPDSCPCALTVDARSRPLTTTHAVKAMSPTSHSR